MLERSNLYIAPVYQAWPSASSTVRGAFGALPSCATACGCPYKQFQLPFDSRGNPAGHTHDSDADGSPRDLHTTPMPMVHHGTYTRLRCRWLTTGLTHALLRCRWLTMGLTHYLYADGLPWDLHTTPMPMAHHGTYTRLRCRWLTTGLTNFLNADGLPWDWHATHLSIAHHGTYTRLRCRWLTTGLTHALLRCRWLTMGLTHDSDADGSPWDLHTAPMPMAHHGTDKLHGCRWLTIGLARNSSVDSSSRDLHTTRMTYT